MPQRYLKMFVPLTVLAAVETANPQVAGRATGHDKRVGLAHSRLPVGLRLRTMINTNKNTARQDAMRKLCRTRESLSF